MTHWFTWFFLAALFVVYMIGCAVGYDLGSDSVTLTKDSRDLRRVECDLADVKARLATLERVRIEVNLTDKTNTWFVKDGKVE